MRICDEAGTRRGFLPARSSYGAVTARSACQLAGGLFKTFRLCVHTKKICPEMTKRMLTVTSTQSIPTVESLPVKMLRRIISAQLRHPTPSVRPGWSCDCSRRRHPRAFRLPSPVSTSSHSLGDAGAVSISRASTSLGVLRPAAHPAPAAATNPTQAAATAASVQVTPRFVCQKRRSVVVARSCERRRDDERVRFSGVSACRGARGTPPRTEPRAGARNRLAQREKRPPARSSRDHAPLVSPPLARR